MTTQKYLPMALAGYYDTLGGFFPTDNFLTFYGIQQPIPNSQFHGFRIFLCTLIIVTLFSLVWFKVLV